METSTQVQHTEYDTSYSTLVDMSSRASKPRMSRYPSSKFSGSSSKGILDLVDLTHVGERLVIPRINIYGSQPKHQYSRTNLEQLNHAMRSDPEGFLLRYPPVTCALYSYRTVDLILLNGHHRIREAGKFVDEKGRKLIKRVPSIVISPEEYVSLFNQHNESDTLTTDSFVKILRKKQLETLTSFNTFQTCSKELKWNPQPVSFADYLRFQTY